MILPNVSIGRNCRLNNVVVDKGCDIAPDTVIGEDLVEDAKKYHVSPNGIVLVTPDMLDQNKNHVR